MCYRFAEDYSGEVIGESRIETLEPYIGLNYPATDIPQQARALYYLAHVRMIYSASAAYETLQSDEELDLSLLSCRGVSPFHLQYLSNMGMSEGATASLAINVNGKLWGLISLHRSTAGTPNLAIVPLLIDVANTLSSEFHAVIELEQQRLRRRSQELEQRFHHRLSHEVDLAWTLLMSNDAIYRLTGGVGAAILSGDVLFQVGITPGQNISKQLFREHLDSGDDHWFCHHLGDHPLGAQCRGLGGYAFLSMGHHQESGLIVFRREINQTVTWGGDPRRLAGIDIEDNQPYTPRASFSRWVETVEGGCSPWDPSTRHIVTTIRQTLANQFAGGEVGKLAVLMTYSFKQLANATDMLHQRLRTEIDDMQQHLTLAVAEYDGAPAKVITLSAAAAAAFNINLTEAEDLPIEAFNEMTDIDLTQLKTADGQLVSVWTQDRGHCQFECRVKTYMECTNLKSDSVRRITIFSFEDVTEVKRAQRAIESALMRSRRSAEVQANSTSQLLHDLRTPLNSIIGFSAFLNEGSIDLDEQRELISRIVESAESLQGILDHANARTSILKRQATEDAREIEVGAEVRKIVRTLELGVAELGTALTLSIAAQPLYISVVPSSLAQIVTNLVMNAAKFSDMGGTVSISVSKQGQQVIIEVKDSGIGMSPAQLKQATAPFKRFTDRPGSGLGLTIVSQLVEANGGTLELASELGHGTRATVSFPNSDVHSP